ncbi:MAG: LysM peptidoglycan-binding domain-containing protein [Schleiferiaceae bacterium]|nr:LysM peptidoglycan-binding domain-containing protein [Schleiferiaceae bacterium]
MKKLFTTTICSAMLGFQALAFPAANIDEGYLYWSQRYSLENASPSLCLADSASSLHNFLLKSNLHTDVAVELENNCNELMFMAGVLPEMSKNMNQTTRDFFKYNYGIAMHLSGLNPLKHGQYHRSGWWMLSYPVALKYGLRIDEYVDERHDPVRASEAAYKYYLDLQEEFKNEDLTVLAFVTSPIEAKEAKLNIEKGNTLSEEHEQLLTEIKSLRASFNWLIQRMPFTVTVENKELKELDLERDVQLSILLEELGIGEDDFMRYNPMITGDVVPGDYGRSIVLPEENFTKYNRDSIEYKSVMHHDEEIAELWEKRERIKKDIPDPRTHQVVYHKVKSGDNLGLISERYGVSIKSLKSWNSMRTDVIYIGQKLTVYHKAKPKNNTSSVTKVASQPKKKIELPQDRPKSTLSKSDEVVIYTVKNGDTMWSIARSYPGVSADNIMDWNNASTNIQVGQKLKIKKSEIRQ